MGVGMPASIMLDEFGAYIKAAFGHTAYHVGSSLKRKRGWRDVDVRLILPDEEWAAMGLGDSKQPSFETNRKWISLVLAYSALGRQMTGLPIDFQIQPISWANEKFASIDGHPRSALGIHVWLGWKNEINGPDA